MLDQPPTARHVAAVLVGDGCRVAEHAAAIARLHNARLTLVRPWVSWAAIGHSIGTHATPITSSAIFAADYAAVDQALHSTATEIWDDAGLTIRCRRGLMVAAAVATVRSGNYDVVVVGRWARLTRLLAGHTISVVEA